MTPKQESKTKTGIATQPVIGHPGRTKQLAEAKGLVNRGGYRTAKGRIGETDPADEALDKD